MFHLVYCSLVVHMWYIHPAPSCFLGFGNAVDTLCNSMMVKYKITFFSNTHLYVHSYADASSYTYSIIYKNRTSKRTLKLLNENPSEVDDVWNRKKKVIQVKLGCWCTARQGPWGAWFMVPTCQPPRATDAQSCPSTMTDVLNREVSQE